MCTLSFFDNHLCLFFRIWDQLHPHEKYFGLFGEIDGISETLGPHLVLSLFLSFLGFRLGLTLLYTLTAVVSFHRFCMQMGFWGARLSHPAGFLHVSTANSRWVHEYQVRAAFVFASASISESYDPCPVLPVNGCGPTSSPSFVQVEDCLVCHLSFARKLADWLHNLTWFPQTVEHPSSDVSWLELFCGFIHDVSCLLPFRVGTSWVTVDDDISYGFVLPPVKTLFRTWRCCLDALMGGGMVGPWVSVPVTQSAIRLGARPGFSGHVALPCEARTDLSFQFAWSRCLADLRTPFFY